MDSSTEPRSHWSRVVIIPFDSTWMPNPSGDVQLGDAPRFIPRLC